jgi:Glycosyl hydrolase family 12
VTERPERSEGLRGRLERLPLERLAAFVLALSTASLVSGCTSHPRTTTPSVPTHECSKPNYDTGAYLGHDPYGPNYQILNDVWNPISISQTLYTCNFDSFYVDANVHDKGGAVQSYPSSQYTFTKPVAIDMFSSLSSEYRFSNPPSGVGLIYEAAYDIWIDGYGGNDHTELMIWTYNHGQRPAGRQLPGTVDMGGQTFSVWEGGAIGQGGDIVTFEPTDNTTSGKVNLLSFLDYTADKGWMKSGLSTPLWQVDFGAELCATKGLTRFDFTYFDVTFKTS